MIIGKAEVQCGSFVRDIAPHCQDIHTMARSYCGSFNLNLLLQTVNVVVPTPWTTKVLEQVRAALDVAGFADYTDLRESTVCIGGQGNSGRAFRMFNYLDHGVRVHVSLQQPGEWFGERNVKYEAGDIMVFQQGDSNRMWRHVFPRSCEQLVFVFTHKDEAEIPNWKLFSKYRKQEAN